MQGKKVGGIKIEGGNGWKKKIEGSKKDKRIFLNGKKKIERGKKESKSKRRGKWGREGIKPPTLGLET